MEYSLYSTHWFDAFDAPLDKYLEKLLEVVKVVGEGRGIAASDSPPEAREPKTRLPTATLETPAPVAAPEARAPVTEAPAPTTALEERLRVPLPETPVPLTTPGTPVSAPLQSPVRSTVVTPSQNRATSGRKRGRLIFVFVLLIAAVSLTFFPYRKHQAARAVAELKQDYAQYQATTKPGATGWDDFAQHRAPVRFDAWRTAALAGEPTAQLLLGTYFDGIVHPYDEAEATKWYRKAADAGIVDAMIKMAHRYQDGRGVTKDEAEALNWYRKAAEAGDVDAMYLVADRSNHGYFGAQKDDVEAAKWYRKAAEAGNVTAMRDFGELLYAGAGVARDKTEAMKWYRKAADGGDFGRRIAWATAMPMVHWDPAVTLRRRGGMARPLTWETQLRW